MLKHVFYIQGLPDFKEQTTLTIVVPPRAGSTLPVEMDFPVDALADPNQILTAPIIPAKASSSQTMPTVIETNKSLIDVFSKPATPMAVSPVVMQTPASLKMVSSSVQAVSPQKPLSPSRMSPTLPASTQLMLPSIADTPPKVQTVSNASPRTQERLTGQQLADQFIQNSYTIQSPLPSTPMKQQTPTMMKSIPKTPSNSPSSPTMSRTSPRLSQVLMSPTLMSPQIVQNMNTPAMKSSTTDESGSDVSEQNNGRMAVLSCRLLPVSSSDAGRSPGRDLFESHGRLVLAESGFDVDDSTIDEVWQNMNPEQRAEWEDGATEQSPQEDMGGMIPAIQSPTPSKMSKPARMTTSPRSIKIPIGSK